MAEDILEDMDDDAMEDFLEEDSGSLEDEMDDEDSSANEADDEKPAKDAESSGIKKLAAGIKGKIPGKLKSKKAVIIILVAVILLIAVAAALLVLFSNKDTSDEFQQDAVTIQAENTPVPEIIFEDIVDLAPFERIHLKTSSTMGLISLNISLELMDHRYRKQIYSMEDRIRQIVQSQVAEMTWLELRNPEGKIRLKYELIKRINAIFPKPTVRNVFFTYFIMQ